MNQSRRDFLARFLQTAAGAAVVAAGVVDLDALAWTPGERSIFLPAETIIAPNLTELLAFEKSAFGKALTLYQIQEALEQAKTMPIDMIKPYGFDPQEWQQAIQYAAQKMADDIDRNLAEQVSKDLLVDYPHMNTRPTEVAALVRDRVLDAAFRPASETALLLNKYGIPTCEPRLILTDDKA